MLKAKHGLSFIVAAVSVLLLVACSDGVSPSSSVTGRTSCDVNTDKNCFMDSRDGQTYKTVTIGTQTWMAQNLNYETANSYCYDDNASYCSKYGRLYTWAAAMDSVGTWSTNGKGCGYNKTCSPTYPVRGVCPEGWHLPTKEEFKTLFTAVGGQSTAGKVLKSTSGWNSGGNGSDAFAFSALPAGNGNYYGNYYAEGDDAYFWSSTEVSSYDAYSMDLYYSGDDAYLSNNYYKHNGLSVRCLKDDGSTTQSSSSSAESSSSVTLATPCKTETEDNCEYGELTDSRDSQTYKTVTIGTQTWMAHNLNYAYTDVPYKSGDNTSDSTSWCYKDDANNCSKYGRLYTWAAAMDSVGTWSANSKGCGNGKACSLTYPVRGVCPEGWHLPTIEEFKALFTAVGGQSTAGKMLSKMLKSTSGWNDYGGESGNGSDAFAFSALPAGDRDSVGSYYDEGDYAGFWSSTELDSDYAYSLDLYRDGEHLFADYKNYGFSVRCLKD